MTDLAALKALNEQRWANAKLTRARAPEFKAPAQKKGGHQQSEVPVD
jgi:hypothetical protein